MTERTYSITLDELIKNNGKNGNPLWVLVDGLVYDLTFYDHLGGIDVFEQDPENYRDLFSDFENVGHSKNAKKIMKNFLNH